MLEQSHEQLVRLSVCQSENAADCGFHFETCRHVCGMDCDFWWLKVIGRNFLLDPEQGIVTMFHWLPISDSYIAYIHQQFGEITNVIYQYVVQPPSVA